MEPTGVVLLLGVVGLVAALIAIAHLRREKRRRATTEWRQEPLRPLSLYKPPDIEAFAPIRPGAEDIVSINLRLPEVGDSSSATERQRRALVSALGNEFATEPLTKEQASILLDVCSYLNGVWRMKFGLGAWLEPSARTMFLSAILAEDGLWQDIRAWGRRRYQTNRDEQTPRLATGSKLYKRVAGVVERVSANPRGYLIAASPPTQR